MVGSAGQGGLCAVKASMRSIRVLVRGLRCCGVAVALHGMLLGLATAVGSVVPAVPDPLGAWYFWVLAAPALLLTRPMTLIFWKLGLMNAPGWFAWPTPLGVALGYGLWVAVLFALALLVERSSPGAAS